MVAGGLEQFFAHQHLAAQCKGSDAGSEVDRIAEHGLFLIDSGTQCAGHNVALVEANAHENFRQTEGFAKPVDFVHGQLHVYRT